MSPSKLALLMKRKPTEHGMYITPGYLAWRDTPRKWISLTTWSGQNFVVEDK